MTIQVKSSNKKDYNLEKETRKKAKDIIDCSDAFIVIGGFLHNNTWDNIGLNITEEKFSKIMESIKKILDL